MSIAGWYYLHENGDLIYKSDYEGVAADIRDSSFAVGLWPCDPRDREGAWSILVEALASGANKERIEQLAEKWGCNDKDAPNYASRVKCTLTKDGSAWLATRYDFINLQESPSGFGDTALEAFAELAKDLGYKPATMWADSFKRLLNPLATTGTDGVTG